MISWTDHVRNEVLNGAKEERNILPTVRGKEGLVTTCVDTAF
jgi:hypothetical protein